MKHNTEAQKAVDTMRPLLENAAQAAQEKRQTALERMSSHGLKQQLLDALTTAESKPDAAVLQQFAAMLPAHRLPETNYLPMALLALHASNHINDQQAVVIAQALLALIRGELPAGLINVNDDWHMQMSTDDLSSWLGWLKPNALEQIKQDATTAALDFASASYEIKRVKQMQDGLELLSAQPYKAQPMVKVLNTSARKFGVKVDGVRVVFEAEETNVIDRATLAGMMHIPQIQQHFNTGILEVLR